MAIKVNISSLPDVRRIQAVTERERDLGRIKHPEHPGVLQLAEGDALVGRLAGENEAVIGSNGGEGEDALRGVAICADRHRATLERHPILSTHQHRSINDRRVRDVWSDVPLAGDCFCCRHVSADRN